MPRATRNPAERDLELLEQLEKRVRQLERRQPRRILFTADDGAYAIVGVQDDGSVGLKLFDNTGAETASYTAT